MLARVPAEVKAAFTLWLSVATVSGASGPRKIRGFNDEALRGESRGFRATTLHDSWRIVYRTERSAIYVERLTRIGDSK